MGSKALTEGFNLSERTESTLLQQKGMRIGWVPTWVGLYVWNQDEERPEF